jgi:hypothetical protein
VIDKLAEVAKAKVGIEDLTPKDRVLLLELFVNTDEVIA